jgi:hypothetical protein
MFMAGETRFNNVAVVLKANVYFSGKVVSHTIEFPDGSKKTLGIIYPGAFRFDTGAPETMTIIAGSCAVRRAGEADFQVYAPGSSFDVPGRSSFEITVEKDILEYLCSYK